MNVIVYHGNGSSRALLREREFWYSEPFVSKEQASKLRSAGRVKFHILITTYEVALKVKLVVVKRSGSVFVGRCLTLTLNGLHCGCVVFMMRN